MREKRANMKGHFIDCKEQQASDIADASWGRKRALGSRVSVQLPSVQQGGRGGADSGQQQRLP